MLFYFSELPFSIPKVTSILYKLKTFTLNMVFDVFYAIFSHHYSLEKCSFWAFRMVEISKTFRGLCLRIPEGGGGREGVQEVTVLTSPPSCIGYCLPKCENKMPLDIVMFSIFLTLPCFSNIFPNLRMFGKGLQLKTAALLCCSASLAKWLSVCLQTKWLCVWILLLLRTKWLWVWILLLSLTALLVFFLWLVKCSKNL